MFLYGNEGEAMTDSKSIIQQLEKTKSLTRQTASMDAHEHLKAMAIMDPLPKDIIGKSLRNVLESQSRLKEVSKISQHMPNAQIQKAMDAAMAPSRAIKAAMNAMPSAAVQKTIQQVQMASVPKMRSLPIRPITLTQLTPREKYSDHHVLRNVVELGDAIRRARKSKGLTQQNFADLAGVGRRFVSELEQGKQTLEIGKVLKVAAAAGIQLMFIPTETNP